MPLSLLALPSIFEIEVCCSFTIATVTLRNQFHYCDSVRKMKLLEPCWGPMNVKTR
eukprot:m.481731 g.481731  ORF g.481731 m.481731 type:complete len:56 (+) comp57710_c0_seq1:1468-1635(+)